MTAALIRCRVNDVGMARVQHDIADPRVFTDVEHAGPGAAAIPRTIQAAVSARRPERPLRGDIHDIGVARIDRDLADVLRLLQACPAPGFSAVFALVHTVAEPDAALRRVLTGAHPDHSRVARVDGYDTRRIGSGTIEDRTPGRSRIR